MGIDVLVLYGARINLRCSKAEGMEEMFVLWEYYS